MDSKRFLKDNNALMFEYNYIKNAGLDLASITLGSHKKIYWKCSICGYEWQAIVKNRANGTGCPKCCEKTRGERLTQGKIKKSGSLLKVNPSLAKEWHPTKNIPLTPEGISPKSSKKVWWKCSTCSYEWQATVDSRNTRGCPACAGKVVLKGFNDLSTVDPVLAKDWHPTKNIPLTPDMVTFGSSKRVWWKCQSCGHEWLNTVNRRSNGKGCPVCALEKQAKQLIANKVEKRGSLLETNPELAAEWDYHKNTEYSPQTITAGSSKSVWWKCSICGYEWKQVISVRNDGHGCPQCANEQQTSFPEQAVLFYLSKLFTVESRKEIHGKEVDIYIPEINTAIEYDGRFYHSSESSRKKDAKKDDIMNEHGIRLIRIKENSEDKVDNEIIYYCFDFRYSHLGWAIIQLISLLNKSKSICVDIDKDRTQIQQQYIQTRKNNSFSNVFPEIAKEWHPTNNGNITPDMITKRSHKVFWWKCSSCGYEWQESVNSVTKKKCPCPKCASDKRKDSINKAFIAKRGTLLEKYPRIASEWHPTKNTLLTPDMVTFGSKKKVWWRCSICGYEWQATIGNRTTNGSGCPNCYKKSRSKKQL